MEQMTEEVMCVFWLDGDEKKYSLHLDLDQALQFVNGWRECGCNWGIKNMCRVLTNEEGLRRIRLGNHGEFFKKSEFEEFNGKI